MNAHKLLNLVGVLIIALSLTAIPSQPAYASATLIVNTLLDSNTNDGLCSLREAIIAANSNADYCGCTSTSYGDDTINFGISGTIVLTAALPNIVSGYGTLTIDGSGQSIIISGDTNNDGIGNVRVFYVSPNANLSLIHLTITHGFGDRGGGIWNDGFLTMSDTVVTRSKASWGGGIYSPGTARLNASIVNANTATTDGAGLYNNHGTMIIENGCVIGGEEAGNMAIGGASAAGIFNYGGILTIDSSTISHNTSANGAGGIFIYGGAVSITNSIITENAATYYGGGISSVYQGFTTVTNSTISNNSAKSGGGMYNYQNNPSLTNVTFSGNTVSLDGGGMNNYQSNPGLTDVIFYANTAVNSGGGMYNELSNPQMMNVFFSANSTASVGGGMYNYNYSNPTLTNVIFDSNSAEHGGGMRNYHYSSPILTNVTFNSNKATHSGGGLFSWDNSYPTLTNVTFSANTAAVNGGGMYNYLYSSPRLTNVTFSANSVGNIGGGMYNEVYSAPVIQDSIFWGNGTESFNDGTSKPTINDSLIQGGCPVGAICNANIIDANPLLGALANNGGFTQTMALGAGSPAIDVGNNTTCAATDQRGIIRPQDGNDDGIATCDMGAFEYVRPPNQPPVTEAGGPYTIDEGSSVTLTATGTDPEGQPLTYVWDLDNNGLFETAGQTVSFDGLDGPSDHTVSIQVTDDGGLTATAQTIVHVNNALPIVAVPAVSLEPSTEGSTVATSASFTDPAGILDEPFNCTVNYGDGTGDLSGIISGNTCNGPDHVYSTFGAYVVSFSITDKDGGTGSNSITHIVIFNWAGFFPPVDNPPIVNLVKAGQAVPVMFSLGSNEGLNIFAVGYPQSRSVTCNSNVLFDDVEQTVTAGSSSLTYDLLQDQYIYILKTDKAWAGTCRLFTVKLIDGTIHQAIFKFK